MEIVKINTSAMDEKDVIHLLKFVDGRESRISLFGTLYSLIGNGEESDYARMDVVTARQYHAYVTFINEMI